MVLLQACVYKTMKSDKVIVLREIIEDKVLNIVSPYTLQVGRKRGQKEEFWQEFNG